MRVGQYLSVSFALTGVLLIDCEQYAAAQQATISTPNHSVSDSFFEQTGVQWGLNWNGGFFRFGGPNMAQPPVGNFDPSAGANVGVGFRGNGVDGFANFRAAQGSRRTFTSQTPSVTLPNGGTGVFSDTSQSPFVISYIPVVGGFPTVGSFTPVVPPAMYRSAGADTPVARYRRMLQAQAAQRRQSAKAGIPDPARQEGLVRDAERQDLRNEAPAERNRTTGQPSQDTDVDSPDINAPLILLGPDAEPKGRAAKTPSDAPAAASADPAAGRLARSQRSTAGRVSSSVLAAEAAIAREQAAEQAEARKWFRRGQDAAAEGKPRVAKIYFEMAARRASDELQQAIRAEIAALGDPP